MLCDGIHRDGKGKHYMLEAGMFFPIFPSIFKAPGSGKFRTAA